MGRVPKKPQKWVLGYAKDGFLVDYLKHPDFIFDSQDKAVDMRPDGYLLLRRMMPWLQITDIFIAPLDEFM